MPTPKERPAAPPKPDPHDDRRANVLTAARAEGLLDSKDTTITGQLPNRLVEAAKARSGARTDAELLLYALSKVAVEDDFGRRLVARKGRLAKATLLGI